MFEHQVYLTHNNITDTGALAIAEVVEQGNGVIRRVRLRDNNVSPIVYDEFKKVFNKPKVCWWVLLAPRRAFPHGSRKLCAVCWCAIVQLLLCCCAIPGAHSSPCTEALQ